MVSHFYFLLNSSPPLLHLALSLLSHLLFSPNQSFSFLLSLSQDGHFYNPWTACVHTHAKEKQKYLGHVVHLKVCDGSYLLPAASPSLGGNFCFSATYTGFMSTPSWSASPLTVSSVTVALCDRHCPLPWWRLLMFYSIANSTKTCIEVKGLISLSSRKFLILLQGAKYCLADKSNSMVPPGLWNGKEL